MSGVGSNHNWRLLKRPIACLPASRTPLECRGDQQELYLCSSRCGAQQGGRVRHQGIELRNHPPFRCTPWYPSGDYSGQLLTTLSLPLALCHSPPRWCAVSGMIENQGERVVKPWQARWHKTSLPDPYCRGRPIRVTRAPVARPLRRRVWRAGTAVEEKKFWSPGESGAAAEENSPVRAFHTQAEGRGYQ